MTDIAPRELTAKLERIATYEQRFRKTPVTAFLRWAGHTRAFATIYRRVGPLIDPWLSRITQGELAARIYGILGAAAHHDRRPHRPVPRIPTAVRAARTRLRRADRHQLRPAPPPRMEHELAVPSGSRRSKFGPRG